MDEQNTSSEEMQGKELYDTQRAEKHKEKESEQQHFHRTKNIKKTGMFLLMVAIFGVGGFGIVKLIGTQGIQGEDFSQSAANMGASHIDRGSPLPEYTSNPPSSGPHFGQTAKTGFREEEVLDQHLIHNLEHGDIWIAYHPRISDDIKSQLKKFKNSKVVITPRKTNDTDIAVVAWGRIDSFDIENDTLDKQRIQDFINRYINRGPERVGPRSGGV